MLDHAIKYKNELTSLFLQISDDLHFQYLFARSYRDAYEPYTSTWIGREFVSVHNGEVIGYFKYSIDRDADCANALTIVNFTKQPNLIFAKDLIKFIKDAFEKYKHRKLTFSCYAENPILESYYRLCNRFGGRIIGIKQEEDKLLDGRYHDMWLFEILRKDYLDVVEKM